MTKKLRICIDLDGTICDFKREGETYADVRPLPGAKQRIDELKAQGHTIIIHTARHMGSTGHNVGLVIARQGKTTLDWLEKHGIQYDEIFFGKPNADITIDDRVTRFQSWDKITDELIAEQAKDE